jgi:hypothetical protein
MRTQIRSLNGATEMKIGDNENSRTARISSIDCLTDYVSRLGHKMAHTDDILPNNATRSGSNTSVFLKSPWVISFPVRKGSLNGYTAFFLKSPWITSGACKLTTKGYGPATASKSPWVISFPVRKGSLNGYTSVFLKSPWITSLPACKDLGVYLDEKTDHSIDDFLQFAAARLSVNHDRISPALLRAA